MNEVKTIIEKFMERYINLNEIDAEADIFGLGVVNSLFVMQLVLFVEQKFSITVDNNDINTDNFNSINSIAKYICDRI